MIFFVVIAIAAAVASGAVAASLHSRVRDAVAAWLRQNGYAESRIMKAWIEFQDLGTKIRTKIHLHVRDVGPATIEVTELESIDDIDDEDLRAAIRQNGRVQREAMDLFDEL